jgi:membrane-bound metal-dependent hydrolase YbcI (DUF457 family)
MEVTGHSATGAAGGAMLVLIPGLVNTPVDVVVSIIGCAGFALLPDIDHPKATAAQTFGWPSKFIARLIEKLAAWVYISTRSGRDQVRQGGHRTLTHTLLFAILMGVLTFYLAGNKLALCIILFLGLCWGIRGFFPKTLARTRFKLLPRKIRKAFPKGSAKLFLYCMAAILPLGMHAGVLALPSALLLALIVLWGSLIHSLGDCLTNSGSPLLYPLPIRRQVWYRFRTPARFNTGSDEGRLVEKRIKMLCFSFILLVIIFKVVCK